MNEFFLNLLFACVVKSAVGLVFVGGKGFLFSFGTREVQVGQVGQVGQ